MLVLVALRMPGEQARAYRREVTRLRELVRSKIPKAARIVLMEQHVRVRDIIPVMFEPEWPDSPYQAILPKDQRVQRLQDWLPDLLPNSPERLYEDLLPFRTPEEKIDALAAKLRGGQHPVVDTRHVHNWIEYMLRQHEQESNYRLDTIYRRYLAVIILDPRIGRAAFLRRCAALWDELVSNEETKKAGRPTGSLIAKNRPELQQLGAYRMVRVFGFSIEEAIAEIIERLGDAAYYTDPRSLERAIEETEDRLRKFLQPPDLNAK